MKDFSSSQDPVSPKEFFEELSKECEQYQINNFDVYNDYDQTIETSSLRKFESEVACFLRKESGLFLPAGTIAQHIVMKVAEEISGFSQFVIHWSSHIMIHIHDAHEHLLKMNALVIPPDPTAIIQEPVTYDSFITRVYEFENAENAESGCEGNTNAMKQIAVVILECPHREIGGKITSYEDLKRISEFCRTNKIHFHMDGARLWEASAAYSTDCSMTELYSLFDTVYVSFYKGLEAVTGAMLLGSTSYLQDHARIWLRRFGGNLFSHLPYYVSCLSCFNKNKNDFIRRRDRFVEIIQFLTDNLVSQPVNQYASGDGLSRYYIFFDPPLPVVSMVHVYVHADVNTAALANKKVMEQLGTKCFGRFRPGKYGALSYSRAEINLVRSFPVFGIFIDIFFFYSLGSS
jgi:threonine aldolase